MMVFNPKFKLTRINILFAASCLLIFIYAFLIFYNRGALGEEEGYRRGGILILNNFLMITVIFLYRKQLSNPPLILKVLIIWSLWFPITCIHLISSGPYIFLKGLMEVLYCPLFFICFYIFIKKNALLTQRMVSVFMILLGFLTLLFIYVFRYHYSLLWFAQYKQLNDVFYVLLLLPWVLLCRKHILRYGGMLVVAGVVYWSLKRTALVALVLALITFFLTEGICSKKKMKVRWIIASICTIFVIFLLFSEFEIKTGGTLTARMTSISEDEGSGRLNIYDAVFRAQGQSSITGWFFGHGHDGVRRELVYLKVGTGGLQAMSAHNDWLEVLFDYGLPGLFLYGLFHFSLLQNTRKLIRKRSFYAPAMAASYVLFFVMSMTTHLVLYPTYFSYLMAFWGMIYSSQEEEQINGNVYNTRRAVYGIGAT